MNWKYFLAGVAVGLYIKPRVNKKIQELVKAAVAEAAHAAVDATLYATRPSRDDKVDAAAYSFQSYQQWLANNAPKG